MNIKKFIFTVFVGINIVTLWCHQPEPIETITVQVPKSLVPKQSFDCVLATDFNTKTDCVKKGYVLLGTVANPTFTPTKKRTMALLENQKFGFIFYRVPPQQCKELSSEPKQDKWIDISRSDLLKSVENKSIRIAL